ncbi:NAD(P)/FAD-dependent oxidoreductase [Agrobacterium vitis]|uniref:Aminoacetone oxidase family FAD-binding enzyme n=1 Tax=Agrobacterium vitis TaxID=373 RepID=A0AAE4WGG8_AGRVI|nr:NAD(P)/FAD-dependent oxidoreductase [Agrobacterium vitis]MCF1499587.1 NAD(P)/FAD-dependent oxidoreductase [Allorhizobium sp. Av2]MCM2440654.1 NAD(P)/FAD-dependent oxidoreductase [Agrobacterium vitis]MUZ59640.1 aminoacetone oxidase family FAD-binding enzyme [Agrobacterium vitis]MVA66598.1 aminoacetone oxidase family FAD-binding enzyme [Agrobacterium vitis]MVA87459.1 aminoacetone oxidase family FAD-binding enzyme [Agrobacterium vitis]
MTLEKRVDVVVIGAGAAGMMAAIRAGQRGRSVAVLDHAKAPGEKIRISGGGRCNFTNVNAGPKNYISANPHFAKSALARFTPTDFIAMVERHRIGWHEKTLGQLFCDDSAKDIIRMLLEEMRAAGARLHLQTDIRAVEKTLDGFRVETSDGTIACQSLIIATGGKSIPKMGATGFAYRLAEQFGIDLVETRPALVPLTLEPGLLEELAPLSGMAVDTRVRHGKTEFREALLFTHRGLSGPAILQISSYWREGEAITLSLQPELDFLDLLKTARRDNGRQAVQTVLGQYLPKRLAQYWTERHGLEKPLADLSDKVLASIADALRNWQIKPAGSEGYRTAEVTLGGIDTQALDSKTMQAKAVPGLYFIGEAVDVTGWLGGYNFQWAWASGHAAGLAA